MAEKKLTVQQKLQLLQAQAATDRAEMLQHMLQYAETDLLCYRAPEVPSPLGGGLGWGRNVARSTPNSGPLPTSPLQGEELRARQAQHFTPLLEWAATTHGITLQVTDGIMPIAQPEDSIRRLATLFAAANDVELAALSLLVSMLGSAILTLALWHGQVGIDDVLIMARLDEAVQAEAWGADPHVAREWEMKCKAIREVVFFLT